MKLKHILSLVVMFFSSLMMSAQEESFNEKPNEPTKVKSGFLILESNPSGAQVFITQNGEERYEGETPFQKKLPYGTYNYRIKKSRYHDEVGVAVVDNTRVVQNIKLRPTFGTLKVTTKPSGAKVTLESDGRSFTSPCEIENIPSGEHYVSIVSPRYSSLRNKVLIQDGQVTPLNATLDARFAQVIINTLPNAKIVINGEQRGVGRFEGELGEGIYDVEVSLAQHRSVSRQIEVVAKQPQTITINPTPIYGSLDVITTPMYAEVEIDGKSYGTTPTTIENLLIDDYEVILSKEGCATEIRRVTITENSLSTIETTLAQGREMTIRSDAQGDEVYIDGTKHGVTPLKIGLSFGIHNIEIRRGGKKLVKQVNVTTADPNTEIKIGFGLIPQWSSDATAEQKRILEKLIKDMVKVKGGTFTMGATAEQGSDAESDEKPTHRVILNTYYIGKYEVTQEQWEAVMGSNPSYFKGANNPVEKVSWDDCLEFIKKLNQLTGLHFRLSTEAEWEYAARGGDKRKGYKYSGSNTIGDVAWYNGNSSSMTHPVGTKSPNELGIYDMSGNVWEWCSDRYGDYSYSSQTNPMGPTSGSYRVFRGGSGADDAQACRVSRRAYGSPDSRGNALGFRLVCDTPIDGSLDEDTTSIGANPEDETNALEPKWSSDATAEQKRILGKLIKDMVEVDGGTFTMGATAEQGSDAYYWEKPTHRVILDSYYIGKYEVTQEQWEAVMGSNPSRFSGNNKPVEQISWNDCQKFIERLNQLTGLNFRLPTEAEWEYAARGGNKSKGYKYSGSNTIGDVAWYYVNAKDVGSSSPDYGTHQVGTKAPNELGIYDMSGNVWEWCSDWCGSYSSSSQTNPTGPTSGSSRVNRGGSWNDFAQDCRVSRRHDNFPVYRGNYVGFRLVCDTPIDGSLDEDTTSIGANPEDETNALEPKWSSDATAEQKRILGKLIKDMVEVDGGSFTMGATSKQGSDAASDEKPTHRVTLDTYYIGKYEVTQEQWKAVMGNNPSEFKGANKPVENVSWYDCLEFIEKLNQLTGLLFFLPTEAEWEYAARGGNKSKGYKYSGSNNISYVAWYNGNSTHQVGTKAPNELGIYDMSGNVYEWCSDWYGDYSSSSQTNPMGPTSGSDRVYRGGSWTFNAQFCRVSYRDYDYPDYHGDNLGLRLVCSSLY